MSKATQAAARRLEDSSHLAAPPAAELSLFRPEVMAEQQTHWLGKVLLAPRLSHTLFAVFAAAATASVLALLFFGHYTHKARIAGWLVPELGVVRVYAPQPGRVAQMHVQEGVEVKKGDPMASLSTELESEALGGTRQAVVRQLTSRRNSLNAERERQRQLFALQAQEFSLRMATIESERGHLDQEVVLQRTRADLAE